MNTKNHTIRTHLAGTAGLCGLLVLAGCFSSEKSSSTGPNLGSKAVIEGRVLGESTLNKGSGKMGISGAAVFVAQVQADGSLKEVSEARVTTDASGRFEVEAALDGVRELVIVAKEEAREWKSVVSAEVKKGAKAVSRPLTSESSLEAEVFAQIHADGQAGLVHFSHIAAHIDAEMAAKVKSEGRAEAKVALAKSLTAAAKARAEVMKAAGATVVTLEKVKDAEAEAQARLEADLHASVEGASQASVAYENHRKARFKAHTDAGIRLNTFGQSQEAGMRSFLRTQSEMKEELRLALARNMAEWQARSSSASAQAEFKAAGAAQAHIDALAKAEADLVASIRVSGNITAVDSAFESYRQSLWTEFKTAFSEQADAMLALKDSSTARATLEAELKVSVTDDEVAKAYARYYAKLNEEAKAGLSGMDAATAIKFASLGETAILVRADGETKIDGGVGVDSTQTGGGITEKVASALRAGDEARLRYLTDIETSIDEAEAKVLVETSVKAEAELENAWKAAAGDVAKLKAAGETYVKTMTEAYVEAEADARAFAVAQEAYARALLKQAAELEGEARLLVIRRAMRTKALAVSAAVTAQFKVTGASDEVMTALDAAALSLVKALDTAASPEAMAQAFTAFHAAVVVQLQAQFAVHAVGIAGADSAVHAEGGAKATFAAEFSGAATGAAAVKAYAALRASATAELKKALALASDADIDAMAKVLFLASICG